MGIDEGGVVQFMRGADGGPDLFMLLEMRQQWIGERILIGCLTMRETATDLEICASG